MRHTNCTGRRFSDVKIKINNFVCDFSMLILLFFLMLAFNERIECLTLIGIMCSSFPTVRRDL